LTKLSHPKDILDYILSSEADVALVAVTHITGGTLRERGALMAVTHSDSVGYISAGCVDGDIIFQARAALKDEEPRQLIYGEGSPFKDITMPCGGRVEVTILPRPDKAALAQAAVSLRARRSALLNLPGLSLTYNPKLRLRLIGRGAPFTALARLALATGLEVYGQSPDETLKIDGMAGFDHLKDPARPPELTDDRWSAAVFLFHDHSWEPELLKQTLTGEAFYIGAMGSDRTHAARLDTLRSMGVDSGDRIKGPIGLLPAMRDADLLAVSILAEIIAAAQSRNLL